MRRYLPYIWMTRCTRPFVPVSEALPRGFVGVGGPICVWGMKTGRVAIARPPRCVIYAACSAGRLWPFTQKTAKTSATAPMQPQMK